MLAKTNAVCVAVQAFQKATVTVKEIHLTVQTHAEVQLKRMHVEFAMEMGVLVVMTPMDPTTLLHLPPISALSDLTKGTTSKCHAEIRRSSQSLMSLFPVKFLGSVGQSISLTGLLVLNTRCPPRPRQRHQRITRKRHQRITRNRHQPTKTDYCNNKAIWRWKCK